MLAHDPELFIAERSRLEEDAIGNPDLADIVHQRSTLELVELFLFEAEDLAQSDRPGGNPERVRFRVGVLGLDRACKSVDHPVGVVQAVVDGLEPEQGSNPSFELDSLNRLGQKVVGPRLQSSDPVLNLTQCGHHYDRDQSRLGGRFEPAANLESIDPGHLDVEQH